MEMRGEEEKKNYFSAKIIRRKENEKKAKKMDCISFGFYYVY